MVAEADSDAAADADDAYADANNAYAAADDAYAIADAGEEHLVGRRRRWAQHFRWLGPFPVINVRYKLRQQPILPTVKFSIWAAAHKPKALRHRGREAASLACPGHFLFHILISGILVILIIPIFQRQEFFIQPFSLLSSCGYQGSTLEERSACKQQTLMILTYYLTI